MEIYERQGKDHSIRYPDDFKISYPAHVLYPDGTVEILITKYAKVDGVIRELALRDPGEESKHYTIVAIDSELVRGIILKSECQDTNEEMQLPGE